MKLDQLTQITNNRFAELVETLDQKIERLRLAEGRMHLDDIDYLLDPTPNEVIGALHRSKETILRGLVDPNQRFWVWDAYHGTHKETFDNLIGAELIDPRSDYRTDVYQIVIAPRIITAYRNELNTDPDQVPSELFQMLLRRARRTTV